MYVTVAGAGARAGAGTGRERVTNSYLSRRLYSLLSLPLL